MKKKIFFSLGLLWMIIVFLFSSQVGDSSSSTSGGIVDFLINIFPNLNTNIDLLHLIIRKCAHFTIYLIGGIIYFNLFRSYNMKNIDSLIFSYLICTIYAITDEIHQFFVPDRTCSIKDVLIDSIGALIGCIMCILIVQVIIRIKNSFKCKNV